MLQRVETPPVSLSAYREHLGPRMLSQLETAAAPLRGLRVVHINATPNGGGVSELLRSFVPLSRAVGIDAEWYVLPPEDAFFDVTKRIHNLLQGRRGRLTPAHKDAYLAYQERLLVQARRLGADVWEVHDPQPLGLRPLAGLGGTAIWRCHIDCSTPNRSAREYLLPWVNSYDLAVFSMPEFVLPNLPPDRARVIAPAIDPLLAKNQPLQQPEALAILADLGVDPYRPLVSQISRFDPWKNPWQVVDAYRLAKRELPDLQLAMVGVFAAADDPEAPRVYRSVLRHAANDPDIHLYIDPQQVAAGEVNAFQTASTVVLQRSIREGFGLTVAEAMWKARPVIGTPVGGIKVQIQDGQNGFLAESTERCAELIVQLVRDPEYARQIGQAARESVRQRFLTPRLVHDHLQLYTRLAGQLAA